jgi:tetratricopeptide (TPR) repeat protein
MLRSAMTKRARGRTPKAPKSGQPQTAEPGPASGGAASEAETLRFTPRHWLWLLAAWLVTAAVYGANLGHAFQFDELWKVVDNPELRSVEPYLEQFSERVYSEKTTRLVPNLSFVLDYALWEYEPFGYQLTELILHLVNVLLLAAFGLALARRLGQRSVVPVLLGAALFAIHPLNSEAVNYTNARPNVMVTTFYLACLALLLAALQAASASRRALYGSGAALALLGALFSKELAVSLVVMIPVLSWWLWPTAPEALRARLRAMRALAAAGLALGLGVLLLTGAMSGISGILFGAAKQIAGHWSIYMLVTALDQSLVFLQYAGLALLPLPGLLNADRSPVGHLHERVFAKGEWADGAAQDLLAPALASLVLVVVLVWLVRMRARLPYPSFLGLWPFITHGPTSLMPRGEPMVEYRTYLPMAGICLLLGWALFELGERVAVRRPAGAARPSLAGALRLPAVLVLWASLAGMTAVRNQAWLTADSLWLDSLAKLPNNARAHNALGNAAAARGDLAAAETSFRRAIAIDPTYGEGHGNLGSVLAQRGDIDGAIEELKLGATYTPRNPDVHNNLANILAGRGQYADAIMEYQLAIEALPLFAEAYGNMGLAYALQGQHAMAVTQLDQAIEINPRLWRLHLLRGNSLLQLSRMQEAVESYRRSVELGPTEAMTHRQLGKALAYVGDTAGAMRELELSLSIDPTDRGTRAYLEELRAGR